MMKETSNTLLAESDPNPWPIRIVEKLPSLSPRQAVQAQQTHLTCSDGPIALRWLPLRRDMARLGVVLRTRCGWLEVNPTGNLDLREDVTSVALDHGFSVIDVEGPELVTRIEMGNSDAITRAVAAVREAEHGYFILEAEAPSQAYVQLMLEGSEKRIEAAAGSLVGDSLGHRGRLRLERLRLLGLSRGTSEHPNFTRPLEAHEPDAIFTHLAQRAFSDVYGLPLNTAVRMRTFEDVFDRLTITD